ncbi:hypothetical protein QE152_g12428 [Popillia japonica]|uniref:Uncharacterized protein n=1 Tax=Popillia japonica TaxID=7064 RepID=A0AAW1LRV2_POPJA
MKTTEQQKGGETVPDMKTRHILFGFLDLHRKAYEIINCITSVSHGGRGLRMKAVLKGTCILNNSRHLEVKMSTLELMSDT